MRATLPLLAAVILPAVAVGYEAAPPQSFIKPVPGGKLVFVMLLPNDRAEVRKTFPKSGLYRPSEPKAPLWTCDWLVEHERSVTISRDGEWAVRVPDVDAGLRSWTMSKGPNRQFPHEPGWQEQPAAFVYHRGQLVRTLVVRDLFDTSRFSGNDGFVGPVITLDPIDDATGRVRLATAHDTGPRQSATIDAHTGDVVERDSGLGLGFDDCGNVEKCGTPPPGEWQWVWVILTGSTVVGLGTAAVVGLTVMLVRRQKG